MATADIATLFCARTEAQIRRSIEASFAGDHDRLIAEINRHINTALATDIREASRLVRHVGDIFAVLPPAYRSHLSAIEGRLAHYEGKHREAIVKYRAAERSFRRHHNHLAAARLGQGLVDVYKYLGQYDRALAVGKKSLSYFRRRRMADAAARVMTNIGNVYHRLDRNRLALSYYDKARSIFLAAGGPPLATAEFNRANIYANLNHLDTAEALYSRAGEIYAAAGMDLWRTRTRYSIGYLYFLADRHTEALRLFEEVRQAFERLGDRRSVAITQLDLMEVNIHLNQFGTAIIQGAEVAAACRRLGMRYEEAKAEYFGALARLNLGDTDAAAEALQRAARLFRRERNDLWLGMVMLARSRVHLQADRAARALRSADDARRLFVASGDYRRCTDADLVRLDALRRSGREERAMALAARLLKRDLVSYQSYVVHSFLGRVYFERSAYEHALAEYRRAVEVVERMLAGLYPDEIRFFFVADKLTAYLGVVQCLLKLGRPNESFLTNLQALETLNRRQAAGAELEGRIPPSLLAERERLRSALRRLGRFPESTHRSASSVERVNETEQRLWSAEQRIRAHLYPSRGRSSAAPTDDARQLLGDDELLVSYVAAESGPVGAFRATRDRLDYLPLGVDREGLRRRVWELYYVLEKAVVAGHQGRRAAEAARYYLGGLHDLLIAPVIGWQERERLIVLADGIFAQIPYGALHDREGVELRHRRDLRVLVNPSDIRREEAGGGTFQARRNSVFAVLSDRLPAVELEARGIREIFTGARMYVDRDAAAGAFKSELSRSDGFIHIATHASRSSENPLFSRIMLADGPFFPFDLFATGIKSELVALSGCQTAATGLYYGHSFSLAKAFYQAGSRFVLASLWPVSDTVSKSFMLQFYEHLRRTNDVNGAYRSAVDTTAEGVGNPAFWGAFVLLGM